MLDVVLEPHRGEEGRMRHFRFCAGTTKRRGGDNEVS
jgi:hypothetical protein